MKIALLNGSVGGGLGNSAQVLEVFAQKLCGLQPDLKLTVITLSDHPSEKVLEMILGVDALVFATGTYWDSWGSPLQSFLEASTETEGTALWLGVPVSVLVTAHSVGAKGVLSRLQGVLNTYGCLIPPMSGWVYTSANQSALQSSDSAQGNFTVDLWGPDDLDIVAQNLIVAARSRLNFKSWSVDRKGFRDVWIDLPGSQRE
jgi:chromate reductase